jgi:hypothetical protein
VLIQLLSLAGALSGGGGGGGAGTTPSLSAVTVVRGLAGLCGIETTPLMAATVIVSWTITNPDSTLYETRIYQNGIQQIALDTGTTDYEFIANGVEDGPVDPYNFDWQYRVDVVRKSDGTAVSSQTSNTLTVTYGYCRSQ